MNKLLISGVVATLGFVGKLFRDSYKEEKAIKEELKRKQEETEEAERRAKIEAEAKQILDEHTRLFSTITTSSNNYLKGYKIVRHIRMVSIKGESLQKKIAEVKFLLAVEEAGGNGAINMQVVRTHRGGYYSVQGDAVLIEPVPSK